MATENIAFVQSREAGEAMTDKQFYIVQLDATGKIEVGESATDLLVGVLQNAPAAGEQAVYAYGGVAKVKASGAVGVGAWVTSDSSGLATATTTDKDLVIGRHIGTAAGAANDLIEVQLGIHKISI